MVILTWEECGCILKQIQAAAFAVYGEERQSTSSDMKPALRSLLLKILACLREFHQTINVIFLQNDLKLTNQSKLCGHKGTFSKRQLDHIEGLLVATQNCTQSTIPTIKNIQRKCFENNQNELAAVAQVNDVLARYDLPLVDPVNIQRLQALVMQLRQKEQQLAFHRGLRKAQQEFKGSGSGYSEDNFAYGSTPFPTWLTLFTQQAVLDKLVRRSKPATLIVFGASSGSLVFFPGLVLGLRSKGVEILKFLHDVAEQLRSDLNLSDDKCCFECADMVTVSLSHVSILLLTSQCWDAALYQQILIKLELELQSGTLVIDYKNALQSSPHFRLVHKISDQRVSWNSLQTFFIFERK